MTTIQTDPFLKKKDIVVERSQFLQSQMKSYQNSYNPTDISGRRMSSLWSKGDTIWTVTLKRIKQNANTMFNPDNYSREGLIQLRNLLAKEKLQIGVVFILCILPLSLIFPIISPKFARANRDYIFQFYKQSKIISQNLKTSITFTPRKYVQQILKRSSKYYKQ